ncbi:MAG: ribonuclease J [Clostridia bacterium]|nr:ribonuclease J [Clostridia bacterium]
MYAYEYGDDIIVVDCGVAFPTEDMLGIDLVIPDVTYLEKNKNKLKGFVITHGHEDHIGGIPYIIQNFPDVPIYGSNITTALIKIKLKSMGIKHKNMHNVKAKQVIELGEFTIKFINVCHSIAGAFALGITTPVGTVIHTGDFKIDYTPIDGETTDLNEIARFGSEGVLCLLSDSTNAEREGFTQTERIVGSSFDKYFQQDVGRIFIATFSSNIHRLQQIVDSACKYGRKVCFAGRSMLNVKEVSIELGYLKIPDGVEVGFNDLNKLRDNELVVVTTGSQGESMSGLVRMATNEHKKLEIKEGDIVIVSATPIPGNEKFVGRVTNELHRKGAIVVNDDLADVHVSGHAKQEELKLMLSLVKPKYFMPVHGEYRHMAKHAELGRQLGVKPENIFITHNGSCIEFSKSGKAVRSSDVPAGAVMVDGSGIGDVGNIVLRDRKFMSQDGVFIVVVGISKTDGQVVTGPDIISRGFVYVRESEELIEQAKEQVLKAIAGCKDEFGGWSVMKNAIRDELKDYLYQQTKRSPMVLPIIVEV